MESAGVRILHAQWGIFVLALPLFLVLPLPYVTDAQVKSLAKITPGIYEIRLDTRIADVAKSDPIKETQDPKISLYRKFGFGDPDKEDLVNKKLGRRFYEISEYLPADVMSIRITTAEGIVYEVAVSYLYPRFISCLQLSASRAHPRFGNETAPVLSFDRAT